MCVDLKPCKRCGGMPSRMAFKFPGSQEKDVFFICLYCYAKDQLNNSLENSAKEKWNAKQTS